MNLNRYVVVGLDPKKNDFAACTYRGILPATQAVRLYKKLGVTPVLIDMCCILPFYDPATPHTSVKKMNEVTPNQYNPTMFRLPRWLVVVEEGDLKTSYNVFNNIQTASAYALEVTGGSHPRNAFIISVNNGLMTHQIAANTKTLPARINKETTVPSLDVLSLGNQFGVISDKKMKCTTNSLPDALTKARTLPNPAILDFDNSALIMLHEDHKLDDWLLDRQEYLKWERERIEHEAKKCAKPEEIDTSEKLINFLKRSLVCLRRSGQTSWDRAEELFAQQLNN